MEFEIEQGLANGPVAGRRTLGLAGSAGGVHDHDQVVGSHLDLRQARTRSLGLQCLPFVDTVGSRALGTHDYRLHPDCLEAWRNIIQPLLVADHQASTGIREAVFQLLRLPPAIQGHNHGTDRHDGGIGHHPLGVVAHGDGHPVALVDTEFRHQQMTQGIDFGKKALEGPLLFLVDNKYFVAVGAPGIQGLAQGSGGVFIDA